jgi:hypothetical protein
MTFEYFPRNGGVNNLRNGRMTFRRLRHGTKSQSLERNEIEEGTVPFSLYQASGKGTRSFSSGEGTFEKQVERA